MTENKTRCYVTTLANGTRLFIRGRLGPPCAECADLPTFLCDFPIAAGKTCDKHLCAAHANIVAPDTHFCAGHYRQFKDFEDAGGVKDYLENIIPFKEPHR